MFQVIYVLAIYNVCACESFSRSGMSPGDVREPSTCVSYMRCLCNYFPATTYYSIA